MKSLLLVFFPVNSISSDAHVVSVLERDQSILADISRPKSWDGRSMLVVGVENKSARVDCNFRDLLIYAGTRIEVDVFKSCQWVLMTQRQEWLADLK